jgi:hypothetical protein
MSGLIIRVEHMRAAGYCAKGAREFAQRHGFDWIAFVKEGVPAEQLIATGDAMAAEVVAHAERETRENGQG